VSKTDHDHAYRPFHHLHCRHNVLNGSQDTHGSLVDSHGNAATQEVVIVILIRK